MYNTVVINKSIPEIGYYTRTSTYGDEFDLVRTYVDTIVKKTVRNKHKKTVVFIEPQIETGYPDIVVVEFSKSDQMEWNLERSKLTLQDLKLLFEIGKTHKKISDVYLAQLLGYSHDEVGRSLTSLVACGMVRKEDKGYMKVPLRNYYCIRNIIAIEAKIDKWSDAIRQANNNVRFASTSSILMKKDRCTQAMITRCASLGIGVILLNTKMSVLAYGNEQVLPVSYSSLLFNEWLMRYLHLGGVNDSTKYGKR